MPNAHLLFNFPFHHQPWKTQRISGVRSLSTSSESSLPTAGTKHSFLRLLSIPIGVGLAVNAAFFGFSFFTNRLPLPWSKEGQSLEDSTSIFKVDKLEDVKEGKKIADTATGPHERSSGVELVTAQAHAQPSLYKEEQLEVFKGMLDELRKMRPTNAAERDRLNQQKALLKQFIREGTTL